MPRWVDAEQGHLQVRPGRGDHLDPAHPAHPRPRRHRPGTVKGVQVSPARRRGRGAARPRHHRPADEGQDLRRALGDRHRQGRPAAPHLPLPRVRQRRHDARRTTPSASCGRPPSTRSSRSSCSRPARGAARGVLGPGGVRRRAVPRPARGPEARRLRLALGPRGPLTRPRLDRTRTTRAGPASTAGTRRIDHGHHPEVPHRLRAHPAAHRRRVARGERRRALRGARPRAAAPTLTTCADAHARGRRWPPSPRPHAAQAGWAATPPRDRSEILRRAFEAIIDARRRLRHADEPRDGQDRRRGQGRGRPTAPSSSAGSPRRPCASTAAIRAPERRLAAAHHEAAGRPDACSSRRGTSRWRWAPARSARPSPRAARWSSSRPS